MRRLKIEEMSGEGIVDIGLAIKHGTLRSHRNYDRSRQCVCCLKTVKNEDGSTAGRKRIAWLKARDGRRVFFETCKSYSVTITVLDKDGKVKGKKTATVKTRKVRVVFKKDYDEKIYVCHRCWNRGDLLNGDRAHNERGIIILAQTILGTRVVWRG